MFQVTSKVKTSINKVVDDPDSLETMSIASGFSDDSDFINELSTQDEELAFESCNKGLYEEDADSTSIGTAAAVAAATADKMKRMYSITVFNVTGIEAAVQKIHQDMAAKVVVGSVHSEEKGDVFYDEFQAQQLSGRI